MFTPHETDSELNGSASKPDVVGDILKNMWMWIGFSFALGLCGLLYMQLPNWMQLWFDPRLIFLAMFMLFGIVVLVFRTIQSSRSKSKINNIVECSRSESSQ